MKFLNGGWLVKDGFEVNYATHVYSTRQSKNILTLYAPFSYINHKGSTLDGGMMTIELFTPHPDIIGVRMFHYKGTKKLEPCFVINKKEIVPDISESESAYSFVAGDLSAVVTKGETFTITFKYKGRILTESNPRSKGYIKDPQGDSHISEQLSIGVGENIYGLGERFTNFVKNGQTVDIWNADGGTGTEQAYKNIPFYVSSNGYGVFVNTPGKASFEIGSEKVSKVQFSVPGEMMEYYVIGGGNLKQVLENYTDLTGKPSMPPAWSFGLWLSTSFLTDYDEKTVTSFVDGMAEHDIPLEVFHFDCLWMKEYEWCNFTWDQDIFPEPEKMLARLKAKGLKICVWINPYIGQKSPLFDEGMEKGYFLTKANGDIWQWDKWQAGMAIVDFTNPAAVKWYQSQLTSLLDMGVDSFKTDFGERIPIDCVYYDGSDPERMHNYYAYLYNEVVYNLLVEVRGKEEAVVFARSASVGSQKFPVHWGGDSTSDYPSMAETLRAGLSFGLGGFGYWSHDISGFEAGATPDIYKRWTQFGLLSSHSRYHGSWEYKVPWMYGEEAVEVTRTFTKLKLSLMPYLIAQSVYTAEKGIPMMRPMVLEFPHDISTHTLDRQYMLGDNLLVAPIFREDGKVNFYVPETKGVWTNYLTGELYEGGHWYEQSYDYFTLPLLVRPNSIIIEGSCREQAVYDYTEKPKIHVFDLHENQLLSAAIYSKDGEKQANVMVSKKHGQYEIEVTGINKYEIILHGVTDIPPAPEVKVENNSTRIVSSKQKWTLG